MIDRRLFLAGAAAALTASDPAGAAETEALKLGDATAFSFDLLKEHARRLAAAAYAAPPSPAPDLLQRIDYDAHGKIRFKTDLALFKDGPGRFPVTFFHLGRYFQKPVRMHVVASGEAREIIYDPSYFEMPADSPARAMPSNAGFAGFRFQEARDGTRYDWRKNDWVAFLGASYFRAIGELHQYGLSARAIALDTAFFGHPEEFPDFTQIFFETPPGPTDTVTVYGLIDSPSLAGAVRFIMSRREGVTMDVQQEFYVRDEIGRLGIAPLTSMYWFSETFKPTAIDWRPEVHDSDGLAMWTGAGERIWRPLNNPPATTVSAFSDSGPRGFGLLQRDRNFDHYQDGVYYDRRPSLWIEPLGDWGKGAVQLVEIPTDDEIHDNIVAIWVPAEPVKAGASFTYGYRMHWLADEPYPTRLARCVATRLGNGGQPGTVRPKGVRKFLLEFQGDPLADLPEGVIPEPILWASRGEFSYVRCEAVPDDLPGHWRAQFDLAVTGTEPVEMRCYLRRGDAVLSETWLYQYHPAR